MPVISGYQAGTERPQSGQRPTQIVRLRRGPPVLDERVGLMWETGTDLWRSVWTDTGGVWKSRSQRQPFQEHLPLSLAADDKASEDLAPGFVPEEHSIGRMLEVALVDKLQEARASEVGDADVIDKANKSIELILCKAWTYGLRDKST